MKYSEMKMDLFTVDGKYSLAHCISADYKMGAGIAVEFVKRFDMKKSVMSVGTGTYPDCIYINRVFNLVTKERYWHKPTYVTLQAALNKMKEIVIAEDIKFIAMPTIASDLDRLEWTKVKDYVIRTFEDIKDLEILVCFR